MEDQPPQERGPDRRQSQPHIYIHPDVIEVHLKSGEPIPIGTVKLLWAIKLLLEGEQ